MAWETTVEYQVDDNHVNFYSTEPKFKRLIHQYAEQYPGQVEIRFEDTESIMCHVPKSWFKPPKPPIKRQMTDEQRQAASERMKKAREAKSSN